MKYPFTYKVTYYDEIFEKEKQECGISFADSFTDAAEIIEDEYKEILISIDRIYLFEESSVVIITEEEMNKIERR